jgi:hypothetical protein
MRKPACVTLRVLLGAVGACWVAGLLGYGRSSLPVASAQVGDRDKPAPRVQWEYGQLILSKDLNDYAWITAIKHVEAKSLKELAEKLKASGTGYLPRRLLEYARFGRLGIGHP